MTYWLQDYDSPSTNEVPLSQFKNKIIDRCIQLINEKSVVRIGYVVDELKLSVYMSDLVEILYTLEGTGKYDSRVIMYEGSSDFMIGKVPKKAWKDRNWLIVDIVKLITGAVIGFLISLLLHI